MKHDFKTLVNRSDKYSRKWNQKNNNNFHISNDIPPFSVADYDLRPPVALREGMKTYIDEMVFGYSVPGEEYYNSFIDWSERRHNFKLQRDWILDDNGVVSSICISINTFSDVGDGVIIMPPVYPRFAKSIKNNDRMLVECNLINNDGKYTIDFDLLEELTTDPNNKILVFCSPHNPVGRVWTKSELERLADICNRNNVLVISDEIHMDVNLNNNKHIMYGAVSKEALDNSVILTSTSKSFNLAGARTSFVIIKNEKKRQAYQDYVDANCHISLNVFGFKMYELAYNQCEDWFDEFINLIEVNYQLMKTYIDINFPMIKVSPLEGTYLLWLDMRALKMTDDELFNFLANDCQIFINRGDSYGDSGKGFVRWNIATPTWVLEEALERLRKSLGYFNLLD